MIAVSRRRAQCLECSGCDVGGNGVFGGVRRVLYVGLKEQLGDVKQMPIPSRVTLYFRDGVTVNV